MVARKLRKGYGWPDSFRSDAWARDGKRVEEEAFDEERRLENLHKPGGHLELQRKRHANPELVPNIGSAPSADPRG